MTDLIARIRSRCTDPHTACECADSQMPAKVFSVASDADVDALEGDLGFSIPGFYRDLLTSVGNGGYGPGYGLAGTLHGARPEGDYVADLYKAFREPRPHDPLWNWPGKLLPAAHMGCGMYWCIDCAGSEGRVIWFEPNPHEVGKPWDDAMIPLATSVQDWFERWLDGDTFLEEAWNNAFPEGAA